MDFVEDKTRRRIDLLLRKEEEENVKLLAKKYGIPYADLSTFPIELDALKTVREGEARSGELIPFQIAGKHLKIGVRNPDRRETTETFAKLKSQHFSYDLFLVSPHSLEHVFRFYEKLPKIHESVAGTIQISHDRIEILKKELSRISLVQDRIKQTFVSKTTSEALEVVLAGALATDSSDIHIEPQVEEVRLRYRLDGVLHDIIMMPKPFYSLLLSRIKLISELKLNIHEKAQDGRFTIHIEGGETEVRTSILPGPDGENLVLRVLNPNVAGIQFEHLGIHPLVSKSLEKELRRPNGMILTTGPTGSGKTTALYAFLKKIHTPEVKIITLEDPIEYHIPGIEQTQVDVEKGYDFANGLRSILRQDPDVILVGEIRDTETAETAINAALTGHLVFSTLHTNNAAGAIPRLVTLGAKPSTIAPALNIAMAQRLVRKICQKCKTPYALTGKEKQEVKKELAHFPKNFSSPLEKEWNLFRASGSECDECSGTGYKGRTGVFEIIQITEEMERLILQDPTEYDLEKMARAQNQLTMRQDGLLKILRGVTDLPELQRVVG